MKITEIATEKIDYIKICGEGIEHILINKDRASFEMVLQNYTIRMIGETLVIQKAEDDENTPPWEE